MDNIIRFDSIAINAQTLFVMPLRGACVSNTGHIADK